MMLCRFSRWRTLRRNYFTSDFVLADITHFKRSMSISKPNWSSVPIHVWLINISVIPSEFWSVILEFFFRLLLRPYHNNRRAIWHQATKFRPNRATRCGVMTSCTISRWRQRWLNTTPGFAFDDVALIRRSKSIRKPISSTYINPWLRYNYFQFGKTNVRHIEILLLVANSTISQ